FLCRTGASRAILRRRPPRSASDGEILRPPPCPHAPPSGADGLRPHELPPARALRRARRRRVHGDAARERGGRLRLARRRADPDPRGLPRRGRRDPAASERGRGRRGLMRMPGAAWRGALGLAACVTVLAAPAAAQDDLLSYRYALTFTLDLPPRWTVHDDA